MNKIAFIIFSLASGGAERVLTILANELIRKYKIYIITFSSDDPFYSLDSRIEHIKLGIDKESKNIFQSIKNFLIRLVVLKKALRDINANINISFMTHTNILSIIVSKLNGQHIIISERAAYDFYNSLALNILRRIIYPFCDMLVLQTLSDQNNYKFATNNIVIYNPVSEIQNMKMNKKNIILGVGRLENKKGFYNLILAFEKLKLDDWQLHIAGDGPQRIELENLIKKLRLDNVKLLGNKKDIFSQYAVASIFVLCSQREGFPNVLLEAMSCGCAVVSFNCNYGPGEIIENRKNGILVEDQNFEELANEIRALTMDNDMRKKIASEAVRVKEKFSLEKIVKQWDSVIQKVLDD